MTTYSICVEDVDLALLPLRTSYNNFLRKEYYQFEVMETVTLEDPEPSPLYTCHICAIDMPAGFAREHAASIKHRANARITSVAAQRMFALISALPPPSTTQPTTRYCANCATVADDDHYKTREHRDAVTRDNLLWDLMKAYAQEEKPIYDYEVTNQMKLNNDIDKINGQVNDELRFKNYENIKNNNATFAQPIDKNQLTESKDRQKEYKPIQEGDDNIGKNFSIDNNENQYNENNEFTDDSNDNIDMSSNITNANETVLVVKSAILIEYPYETTTTGHIKCVVCKCLVPSGVQSREEHIRGSRHRAMVIVQNQPTGPIGDIPNDMLEKYSENKEFTCVLNDNISKSKNTAVTMKSTDIKVDSQTAYSFEISVKGDLRCIVCNCTVPNNDHSRVEHIRGLKHCRMVISHSQPTQPLELDEEEQTEENNEINENLEEYSEDEHFESNENKIVYGNINEASDSDIIDDSQIEDPLKVTTTGHVECLVCDRHLPSGEHNIEEHVKGFTNRNMVVNKNQATEFIEEKEHIAGGFEINDNLDEQREEEKFNDDNNDDNGVNFNITKTNNMGSANPLFEYPYEVTEKGCMQCLVCDCQVPSGEQTLEDHVKGRRHRNKKNRDAEFIEEDEEQIAENCETNYSFKENIEDEEFIYDNTDNNSTSSNISEANCEKYEYEYGNTIADSQIKYPFELTATGHIKCVVCECKVPSNVRNKEEHVNGVKHRNMYPTQVVNMNQPEESLEDEGQQSVENYEVYDSFEEHSEDGEFIDDNTDNNSMSSNITEANDEEYEYEYGNTVIADSQIEYPLELTATGHVKCVFCECKVPSNVRNREEHVNGVRHRNMPEASIEEEQQSVENSEIHDNFEEYSEDKEFIDDNSDYSDDNTVNPQIEYPYELTARGCLLCIVCECQVPSGEQNKIEHISRHRNKVFENNLATDDMEEEEDAAEDCEFNNGYDGYSEEEEFRDDNASLWTIV